MYGAMCRFGICHINKEGENVKKEGFEEPDDRSNMPLPTAAINMIPRDVQTQLRKKTYPFVRRRYDEERGDKKESSQENGDNGNNDSEEVSSQTTTSAQDITPWASSSTPVHDAQ